LDDPNYGVSCVECHAAAWQSVSNDSCLTCHPGGSLKKPYKSKDPKAPHIEAAPQPPAGAKLHIAVEVQSCNTCHVEHRETPLTLFLRHSPAERKTKKGFPENVHAFIPEPLRGETNCGQCHAPGEIDAGKK
jgi:hypothetical protein